MLYFGGFLTTTKLRKTDSSMEHLSTKLSKEQLSNAMAFAIVLCAIMKTYCYLLFKEVVKKIYSFSEQRNPNNLHSFIGNQTRI